MTELSDKILGEAQGKFQNVVVIGITQDSTIDISTTNPQYPVLHWLLNKALFNISIHEMNNQPNKSTVVDVEAEKVEEV